MRRLLLLAGEGPASLEERQQHHEGVVGKLKVTWILWSWCRAHRRYQGSRQQPWGALLHRPGRRQARPEEGCRRSESRPGDRRATLQAPLTSPDYQSSRLNSNSLPSPKRETVRPAVPALTAFHLPAQLQHCLWGPGRRLGPPMPWPVQQRHAKWCRLPSFHLF